jgi:hypothetical protein
LRSRSRRSESRVRAASRAAPASQHHLAHSAGYEAHPGEFPTPNSAWMPAQPQRSAGTRHREAGPAYSHSPSAVSSFGPWRSRRARSTGSPPHREDRAGRRPVSVYLMSVVASEARNRPVNRRHGVRPTLSPPR